MELTLSDLQSRRFDPTQEPPQQVKLLTIQDSLILSRQNFSILIGNPKAGKSTYSNIIMASACCLTPMYGIQAHRSQERPRFVSFDTEQANYDMYHSVQRILRLSGDDKIPSTFDLFSLRQDDPAQILFLIELYFKTNPDVSFALIDGILDLVMNFNDERECKNLINWMKRVTTQYDIGIIAVLHTGKSTGNTVGHLGSFADRYCQSSMEVTKSEGGLLNLKPKLLRSARDFNPISILRDAQGYINQVDYFEEPVMRVASKRKEPLKQQVPFSSF